MRSSVVCRSTVHEPPPYSPAREAEPLRVADGRQEFAHLRIGKHEVHVPFGRWPIVNAAGRQNLDVHAIEIHGAEQDIQIWRRSRRRRQRGPGDGASRNRRCRNRCTHPCENQARRRAIRSSAGYQAKSRYASYSCGGKSGPPAMSGGPTIGGPLTGPCRQLNAKPGVTSSGVSML